MGKITIDTKISGKTYFLTDPTTPGFFDIKGTFFDWDPNDNTPETIIICLCGLNSDNNECKEIKDINYHISLCEYNVDKNLFQIHVEQVDYVFNINLSYNYVRAKEEKLRFSKGKDIPVEVYVYNTPKTGDEQKYYRWNELPFRGYLKFPKPKIFDCKKALEKRSVEEDSVGLGPERKAGNILVGG